MKIKVKNVAASAAIFVFWFLCQPAYGVIATPNPVQYKLPDGRTVTVVRHGDENSNFMTTTDGYLLIAEPDGELSYATVGATGELLSTGVRAVEAEMRTAADVAMLEGIGKDAPFRALARREKVRLSRQPKQVAPEADLTKFPTTGNPRTLVILVQYQDVGFTVTDPQKQFSDMLNKRGYSDWGATGSAADYYDFCSDGQFLPVFDVYGPVTLPENRAYYGGNGDNDKDIRRAEHIADALAAAREQTDIDFSVYDTDGDGAVDNVYVFYAGYGEADSGEKDAIWPHAWYLKSGAGLNIEYDGKLLDHYACSAELSGLSHNMNGIGTFVHEFTHVLGLMDHYATEYSAAFTPGNWDLMDHGSYNNDQRTPPAMSIYERYCLGWIEPVELEQSENVVLRDIHNGGYGDGRMLSTPNVNEYYLFENRTKTGWDEYLPGEGMLVWHVDYNPSVWRQNIINNNAAHQYLDIVEADNVRTDVTRDGDTFPGSANVREFTDETQPSMKTWDGVALDAPITDITRTGDVVHFQFRGGIESEDIVALSAVEESITKTSFTLSWNTPEAASDFKVTVVDQDGTAVFDHVDAEGDSFVAGNMMPGQKYTCHLTYRNCYFPVDGKPVIVETLPPTLDYLQVKLLEATEVSHDSFVANWEPVADADHYRLTVYEGEETPEHDDFVGFDNKLDDMPDGWTTNVKTFYTKSDLESQPALYMRTPNQYLKTPVYEGDIALLEFDYMGVDNETDKNSIIVSGFIDGVSTELAVINPLPYNSAGRLSLKEIPAGVRQIEIKYERKAAGSVLVDNVRAYVPAGGSFTPIDGYDGLDVGDRTSCRVEDLKEESDYYYAVSAHNQEYDSMLSERGKVTTGKNSGVAVVVVSGENVPARYFNLQGAEVSGKLLPGIYIRRTGSVVEKIVVE